MTINKLSELLKKMNPVLNKGKYFIASMPESQMMVLAGYLDYVIAIYREKEGLTVVFSEETKNEMKELSEAEIAGPFALITLNVHSDLLAVGFLAKMTAALAKEKISVNAFSAYYHDHLLVPYERKKDAMAALKKLTK